MEFDFLLRVSLGKTKSCFILSFTDIPSGHDLPIFQIYMDSCECSLSSQVGSKKTERDTERRTAQQVFENTRLEFRRNYVYR